MIPSKIISKLQNQLPFIIDGFGGVTNFVVYVKEFLDIPIESSRRSISDTQYQEFINYFYTLFKYKRDVIMISPWAMYVDLRDILIEDLTSESINPNSPYQVYDMRGNLKYTVVGHQGIFGESRLDENLVNKAINGSIYFLKYKTFSGTNKVKLLIINVFSKQIRASNQNFSSPNVVLNSTISINTTSVSPADVYLIEAPPQPLSNIDIETFRRSELLQELTQDNPVNYSINTGSWLLIDHSDNTITRSAATNLSNDIVIQVASDPSFVLYYVGLNTDVSFLNQYFNTSLTYSNKPITEIITLS